MDYQRNLAQEFLEFVEQQPRQSLSQLLTRVLHKSRLLTGAEAGTIFVVRRKRGGAILQAINAQNNRIRVDAANFEVPVNNNTISGYVAATGETVIIDDVYNIDTAMPYSFNPANEAKHYKSISMLCFPLKNYTNQVIGVVQLINRAGPGGKPIPFDPHMAAIVAPVARVLGASIERTDMMDQIRLKNKRCRTVTGNWPTNARILALCRNKPKRRSCCLLACWRGPLKFMTKVLEIILCAPMNIVFSLRSIWACQGIFATRSTTARSCTMSEK